MAIGTGQADVKVAAARARKCYLFHRQHTPAAIADAFKLCVLLLLHRTGAKEAQQLWIITAVAVAAALAAAIAYGSRCVSLATALGLAATELEL